MPKKDNRTMPPTYPVCVLSDCPQATHCLHRTAYEALTQTADEMRLVNPERCTQTENCPYFRDNTPVRYARGFKQMRERMYPAQYRQFQQTLIAAFGRNAFYERQRGDYGLPPAEQATVRQALRKAGVADDLDFDAYETQLDWEA